MIVITGSAGFIGSCLVSKFNSEGISDIILVDDFSKSEKNNNLVGKKFINKLERSLFIDWFKLNYSKITYVIHIGARTNTSEFDINIFNELNLTTRSLFGKFVQKMKFHLFMLHQLQHMA